MARRIPERTAADTALALSRIPLFSSLSPACRSDIASLFDWLRFSRGAVIVAEGAPPDWLYVVVDGFIKLLKHSDDGREVILHVAARGDLIGSVSAFGRQPHAFTAKAMVRSEVLRIGGADFARITREHAAIAGQTVSLLIGELMEAHETARSLATEKVERRIARQLVKLAETLGRTTPDGVEIAVPLSRQDVADMAGTTVESAIRVMSRWRRAGLARTVGGRLVLDADAIGRLADAPRTTV